MEQDNNPPLGCGCGRPPASERVRQQAHDDLDEWSPGHTSYPTLRSDVCLGDGICEGKPVCFEKSGFPLDHCTQLKGHEGPHRSPTRSWPKASTSDDAAEEWSVVTNAVGGCIAKLTGEPHERSDKCDSGCSDMNVQRNAGREAMINDEMKAYREEMYASPGRIARVFRGKEDHGIETVILTIEGRGWGQGFGLLCHSDPSESLDFLLSVCTVFGCSDPDQLVGMECVALRMFPTGNEPISGLRSVRTSRTFSIPAWLARRHPNRARSVVDDRLASIIASIDSHRRRIEELQREAAFVRGEYRPIEGEAP